MPKKRCPKCQSINTQRYGSYRTMSLKAKGKRPIKIQRYYCLNCHTSFSERAGPKGTKRYEPSLILKAADLYFNTEASYRAVSRQLHIRAYQLFLWINELGKNCKSFEEVVKELSPQYTGYFLADGTSIPVQREKYQLLLTCDIRSQDIPYAVLCKSEDYESWKMVLKGFRDRIGYPAKGVTIDGDLGLRRAVQEVFPAIPFNFVLSTFTATMFTV